MEKGIESDYNKVKNYEALTARIPKKDSNGVHSWSKKYGYYRHGTPE